jgi:hypothetical protein
MPDPTGRISHIPEMHRGVSWKQPCRVATTANVTISTALNAGDSIDGVTLAAGDRVLVKDQSTGSQNGIYLAGVTPIRDFDMDQDATTSVPASEVMGAIVYVIAGSTNGGTLWRNTNTTAPVLGTNALTFAQITSSVIASAVSIADAGGYFTATDVEAALQELASKVIGYQAHGNLGSTETFSALTGWHSGTLNADCVFTLSGATSGLVASMVLELAEDGTGGWTIDLPSSVVNAAALEAAFDTTASMTSLLLLMSRDGGTNWYGFFAGGGSSSVLEVDDEGTPLTTAATSLDFVGSGVTATAAGDAVTVTIPGASDPADDTSVWMPLTTVVAGDPVLVWDGDDSLIPTLIPL